MYLKHLLFYICFPWKGTLTDAGDGDGGEQVTKNIVDACVVYIFSLEGNFD